MVKNPQKTVLFSLTTYFYKESLLGVAHFSGEIAVCLQAYFIASSFLQHGKFQTVGVQTHTHFLDLWRNQLKLGFRGLHFLNKNYRYRQPNENNLTMYCILTQFVIGCHRLYFLVEFSNLASDTHEFSIEASSIFMGQRVYGRQTEVTLFCHQPAACAVHGIRAR